MSIYEKFGLNTYGKTPNSRQMEWYNREKMIFFHFGMNTFTNKEWGDGSENPNTFNPTELNVRQWIETIKNAGFKCAILTAKHHDGFCLWQTAYTEHSIKNSPYKNGKGDIVKEFTDACAEYGIKAGIYLSPWDRHEKSWGQEEYNDFYVGQLTELLTSYGEISEVWWDGAGSTEAVYDWERWARTVRTLQPNAVIFGSLGATPWVDVRWVGNEKGIAGKPCYSTIDKSSLEKEITDELNHGKLDGDSFIPAEVDVSIRPGWFYHDEQDEDVRTSENLINLWFTSNGSNAGLLLNLPPDRRGLIHENDVKSLLEFNRILTKMLENNLAKTAKVHASSQRNGCNAENILSEDTIAFYAPSDSHNTPEILLEFDREIEFNSFAIKEAIELGHKITGIEISALVNGEWRLIAENKCVGYKWAEKFDLIKASKVKIEILSSLDTPVITSFGLYRLDTENAKNESKKSSKNLAKTATSIVEIIENSIEVNLGGVFKFNQINAYNVGNVKYELYIFNGTAFEKLCDGESVNNNIKISLENAIDYAYRLKLVLTNEIVSEKVQMEVSYEKH